MKVGDLVLWTGSHYSIISETHYKVEGELGIVLSVSSLTIPKGRKLRVKVYLFTSRQTLWLWPNELEVLNEKRN